MMGTRRKATPATVENKLQGGIEPCFQFVVQLSDSCQADDSSCFHVQIRIHKHKLQSHTHLHMSINISSAI
jgi:hypothetical protein